MVTDIGCTERTFRENLILSFPDTMQLFLFTDVTGTDMVAG